MKIYLTPKSGRIESTLPMIPVDATFFIRTNVQNSGSVVESEAEIPVNVPRVWISWCYRNNLRMTRIHITSSPRKKVSVYGFDAAYLHSDSRGFADLMEVARSSGGYVPKSSNFPNGLRIEIHRDDRFKKEPTPDNPEKGWHIHADNKDQAPKGRVNVKELNDDGKYFLDTSRSQPFYEKATPFDSLPSNGICIDPGYSGTQLRGGLYREGRTLSLRPHFRRLGPKSGAFAFSYGVPPGDYVLEGGSAARCSVFGNFEAFKRWLMQDDYTSIISSFDTQERVLLVDLSGWINSTDFWGGGSGDSSNLKFILQGRDLIVNYAETEGLFGQFGESSLALVSTFAKVIEFGR